MVRQKCTRKCSHGADIRWKSGLLWAACPFIGSMVLALPSCPGFVSTVRAGVWAPSIPTACCGHSLHFLRLTGWNQRGLWVLTDSWFWEIFEWPEGGGRWFCPSSLPWWDPTRNAAPSSGVPQLIAVLHISGWLLFYFAFTQSQDWNSRDGFFCLGLVIYYILFIVQRVLQHF